MFVLKEKLINSILIKVKGEESVLYSCWIPLPLIKGKKQRQTPQKVVFVKASPFPSPAYHLHLVPVGRQCLGAVKPCMAAQIFPHGLWIYNLTRVAQINHSLTVSLHCNGL